MTERAVALVIGASRGMGRAMCIDLARHGFDVVPTARTSVAGDPQPMSVEETAVLVREHGGKALPLKCDLGSLDDVEEAVERTMEEFGRIDTLIITANWVDFAEGGSYATQIRRHALGLDPGPHRHDDRGLPPRHPPRAPDHDRPAPGRDPEHHPEPGGGAPEPRLPMSLEPPLTEWLGDPDQPLPNTGQVGSMVPIARGVTDRIAPALMRETAEHNVAVLTLDPSMTLSNLGMDLFEEAQLIGYRPQLAHSVLVPARAATYLATCHNPMIFNGMFVVAEDLVRSFGLMTEAEILPDGRAFPDFDALPLLGHPE